jgi:hypothetical protein
MTWSMQMLIDYMDSLASLYGQVATPLTSHHVPGVFSDDCGYAGARCRQASQTTL